MGIQINGTNDTISAADGSLEVDGFTFKNKTTAQRNAGVSTAIGSAIYNSTTGTAQVYTGNTNGWVDFGDSSFFSASGGTESTTSRTGYKVHTFTSPGTFTVSSGTKNGEYLIVGGGGGGGNGSGGGGGAGGFRLNTTYTLIPGTYSIVVGGGGAGGPAPYSPAQPGSNGTDSEFGTIISAGGGGGGGFNAAGISGGSGGGGGHTNQTVGNGNVYSPTSPRFPGSAPGQGNNGGLATPAAFDEAGGGGGGASTVGVNATPSPITGNSKGGNGGNGSPSSINGTNTTYAGGGGGGVMRSSPGGTGGPGGGGNGAGNSIAATAATANTGGGGGGGGRSDLSPPAPANGAAGGSGIVIIAYPTT